MHTDKNDLLLSIMGFVVKHYNSDQPIFLENLVAFFRRNGVYEEYVANRILKGSAGFSPLDIARVIYNYIAREDYSPAFCPVCGSEVVDIAKSKLNITQKELDFLRRLSGRIIYKTFLEPHEIQLASGLISKGLIIETQTGKIRLRSKVSRTIQNCL